MIDKTFIQSPYFVFQVPIPFQTASSGSFPDGFVTQTIRIVRIILFQTHISLLKKSTLKIQVIHQVKSAHTVWQLIIRKPL